MPVLDVLARRVVPILSARDPGRCAAIKDHHVGEGKTGFVPDPGLKKAAPPRWSRGNPTGAAPQWSSNGQVLVQFGARRT